MTPEEFLDAVRDRNETPLSRLGSSKSLYAETEGEMEADAVLAAAATAEHHAAETFAAWAEDESNDTAREAWAETAAEERDHYETVAAEVGDHEPGSVPAIQAYLRDRGDSVERAGGFVGRVLATRKSKDQMTGFFVGQADPQTAQVFREVSGDLDGQVERGLAVLDAVCEAGADWDRAAEAADAAVAAAYDEYVDRLEAMGVNPKPVC